MPSLFSLCSCQGKPTRRVFVWSLRHVTHQNHLELLRYHFGIAESCIDRVALCWCDCCNNNQIMPLVVGCVFHHTIFRLFLILFE